MATCSAGPSEGGTGVYSPFVRRKLRALGCPFRLDERAPDWKSVRDIVVWLEEEKIRLYPRRRRLPLRTVDSWTEWWSLMTQYCQDLEMPLAHATSKDAATARSQSLTDLLETITSIAIGDVYQDAVEAGPPSLQPTGASCSTDMSARHSSSVLLNFPYEANAVASGLTAEVSEAHSETSGRLADSSATTSTITSKELHAALEPFLALLQLPPIRGNQANNIETIGALRAVATRLLLHSPLSRAEREQLPPLSDEELHRIANRVLVALPAAGRNNKDFLTRFLSGLRALHICAMRDMHERLDVVVEALQTLIGNPVTDSKLGKVGI